MNLDDFPSERPTDSLAGTLFDLLATQGIPGNQANCAIQTLDEQLGLANLDTAGVLGGNAGCDRARVRGIGSVRYRPGNGGRGTGHPRRRLIGSLIADPRTICASPVPDSGTVRALFVEMPCGRGG